jgi:hypothetical protein
MVNVKRVNHGNRQSINSLINEEAKTFARYLRKEISEWIPRTVGI